MPVAWETIWLREPRHLAFPNGERFVVAVESADFDGLSIKFATGRELVLAGVIDADERFLWPRLHLFVGADPAQMFFFGGPVAYRVHSDGHILERLETQR